MNVRLPPEPNQRRPKVRVWGPKNVQRPLAGEEVAGEKLHPIASFILKLLNRFDKDHACTDEAKAILDRIAQIVARRVPDDHTVIRVEADFDDKALRLQLLATPNRRGQVYDSSLGTPLKASFLLMARLRSLVRKYLSYMRLRASDLSTLTVTVAGDGSYNILVVPNPPDDEDEDEVEWITTQDD